MPQEASASIRIRHLHNEAQSRMRKQLRVSLFHLRQTTNVYLLPLLYHKSPDLSNGVNRRVFEKPGKDRVLPRRAGVC